MTYGDDEETMAAAAALARAAEAMRAHTQLYVAQLLQHARQDWTDAARPLLDALADTWSGPYEPPRTYPSYLDLADHLLDRAAHHTGTARAALHHAADAIAGLQRQHDDLENTAAHRY